MKSLFIIDSFVKGRTITLGITKGTESLIHVNQNLRIDTFYSELWINELKSFQVKNRQGGHIYYGNLVQCMGRETLHENDTIERSVARVERRTKRIGAKGRSTLYAFPMRIRMRYATNASYWEHCGVK
jgi:hypothetical protein